MGASKTVICQKALARLGCTTNLSDVDTDTSQEAKLCRIFYDSSLAQILQAYDWPFAQREVEVALVETGLTGKWASHYAYPSDALRILSIRPVTTAGARTYPNLYFYNQYGPADTFEIVGGTSNKFIATYFNEAIIATYIKNETDTTLFPAHFENAFSYLLASELALGLNKSMDISGRMSNAYLTTLAEAKANQKNENNVRYPAPVLTDRML